MQVFIMRHGDAALDAASDSVRPLTTHGCDESRLMANWLKGQKVEIERVLVSPFLRAEQTLEEVGDCLNLPSVSWVSGCRVMSGRNAAYVYHVSDCQRNA